MSKILPESTQISSKLIKRLMLEYIGGQEKYDKIYELTNYINNYVGIDATKLDILLLEKEIIKLENIKKKDLKFNIISRST